MKVPTLATAFLAVRLLSAGATIDFTCRSETDDAKSLNAAIGKSEAGDAIRIHGTCLLAETIVLKGNRSYVGDSRTGTILKQTDGANLDALVASDSWAANATYTGSPVRIAQMTLDGNKANNENTSVLVIRSWLTVVEDLQIANAPADGIRLTSVGRDGTTRITSTQVNGTIRNVFVRNSGANGIHVVDPINSVTDWDLLDSWIASSGESAVMLENAAGWKVKGVHVYGVRRHAFYASRCYSTTIADNLVEDFGGAGGEGNTWYGIACTVQGGAASVISGNKVFRFGAKKAPGDYVFVGLPQVNYGTGMVNVVGNTIRGNGFENETGLSYQVVRGERLSVLSSGNHVLSVGTERAVGEKVVLASTF